MVVRERRRKKRKTSRRTQYNTRRRMVRQTKRVKKRRRKTNMPNKMNRKKYKRTIRRQRLNQGGGASARARGTRRDAAGPKAANFASYYLQRRAQDTGEKPGVQENPGAGENRANTARWQMAGLTDEEKKQHEKSKVAKRSKW